MPVPEPAFLLKLLTVGLDEVAQTIPRSEIVSPPSFVIVPPAKAESAPIFVTGFAVEISTLLDVPATGSSNFVQENITKPKKNK